MEHTIHEWGDRGAPRVICLHGVQAHGRRFRRLAEERLAKRWHVLAPDLRGHGRSGWEPPWSLRTLVDDLLTLVSDRRPAAWIGHSLGGRLLVELGFRAPELLERAVLVDPALHMKPERARELAETEVGDRSFGSREDALADLAREASFATLTALKEELDEHLIECADGRFRFRYSRAAAVTLYGDLAGEPPIFATGFDPADLLENAIGSIPPTLVVKGADSGFVTEAHVASLRRWARGDVEVATVPGGHIPLWDAFDETADAIERFLSQDGP